LKIISLEVKTDLNVLENIPCSLRMDTIEFIIAGTEKDVKNLLEFLKSNSHLQNIQIVVSDKKMQQGINGYLDAYES
jgi:hypothetical protein